MQSPAPPAPHQGAPGVARPGADGRVRRGSGARPWRVWVTRAEPGAAATAQAVRELGHDPLVAPLIETRPSPATAPDLAGVTALAFTSAAGVRAFAALDDGRDLPVFAVGRATAAAAREAGFPSVLQADGAAADLAVLILATPPGGVVLVPGALAPAFDLPAALRRAGATARALPVYETRPAPPPAELAADLAGGRIDAVLLQSASAARAFTHVSQPAWGASRPHLLALSAACLPPGWEGPSTVAAAPRERDLLALLPRLDTPPPTR